VGELSTFIKMLYSCDFLAVTPISEERYYCRFYTCGLYNDRMFVTDSNLLQDLNHLTEGDEVVDTNGVSHLKKKYSSMLGLNYEAGLSKASGAA
jgi:hypothetical protein